MNLVLFLSFILIACVQTFADENKTKTHLKSQQKNASHIGLTQYSLDTNLIWIRFASNLTALKNKSGTRLRDGKKKEVKPDGVHF